MEIEARPLVKGGEMRAQYEVIKTTFFDIIHAEDVGITIMWDRGTRIQIKLKPKFKGKTCGLCGNFNDNMEDDFTTPEDDVAITPRSFGDSWKVEAACPSTPASTETDPCFVNSFRKPWAHKQCNIIRHQMFE